MLKSQTTVFTRSILRGFTFLAVLTVLSGCNLAKPKQADYQESKSSQLESIPSQPISKQELKQESNQEPLWQEVGELPLPLESHQMVALGDYIYVIGGWNEERGPYADVFFAPLDPEKPLNNWQATRAKMPLRLQHHAVITHNQAIYVLGGDNGFGENLAVADRILRAIPNEEGNITKWEDAGQLPKPLTIHSVTTVGDRIYVFGGSSTFAPSSQMLDTVYTATISPENEISPFEQLAPLPTPVGWLTTTVVDDHIFTVSGKTQFSPSQLSETIGRIKILETGFISEFESVGTTTPRERHATVKSGQNLIVIAGGGAQGVLAEVEAIAIDPAGNLQEPKKLPPLPEPRYAHAAFAHSGYVYVSGGFIRYGSNETSQKIFRLPVNFFLKD